LVIPFFVVKLLVCKGINCVWLPIYDISIVKGDAMHKKMVILGMVSCLIGYQCNGQPSENMKSMMKDMPMKKMPMQPMDIKDMIAEKKSMESLQKFGFENETDKACIAKFYYDGAEEFAQYTGFPIKANSKSAIGLDEFWWFEKRGLGLARKGEKSGVVDVLMHHAANRLKITILGVGERDFNISGEQVAQDSYSIKIFYDKSKNIEIRLEKN
jgi:hypothetical protein